MDEPQEGDVVWPPPPNIPDTPSQQVVRRVFSFVRRSWRVTGSVSDFVTGRITFHDEGIQISATRRVRQEIQIPVLIISTLVFFQLPVIVIIIAVFLEGWSRRLVSRMLTWDDIEAIALEEDKLLVGLIYKEPDVRGHSKTYSLAFPVDVQTYEAFHDAAVLYAPGQIFSVSYKPVIAPSTYITASAFVLYMAWFFFGRSWGWI